MKNSSSLVYFLWFFGSSENYLGISGLFLKSADRVQFDLHLQGVSWSLPAGQQLVYEFLLRFHKTSLINFEKQTGKKNWNKEIQNKILIFELQWIDSWEDNCIDSMVPMKSALENNHPYGQELAPSCLESEKSARKFNLQMGH